METGCILFLLEFSLFVHGHTPTFRNEATHPLKAPTESTLGLQINDESIGRTRSNPSKQETYFVGGKHFEYMLLNDSNVLLTSLQNDISYDAVAAAVAAPAASEEMASKEDSFTGSIFVTNNTEENLKPNGTRSVAVNPNDRTNTTTSETFTNAAKADDHITETNRNETFPPRALPILYGVDDRLKINIFKKRQFEKLPDISSTTKLYSKQANSSSENFASFTSPLAAKTIVDLYGDEDEEREEEGRGMKTKANNSYTAVKPNYDYDDSFTKLLISNGILRADNAAIKSTTSAAVVGPGQSPNRHVDEIANPSVEDINRIMGGSVAGVVRTENATESRNAGPLGGADMEAAGIQSTKSSTGTSNTSDLPRHAAKKSPPTEPTEDPVFSKSSPSNRINSINNDMTSRDPKIESTTNYEFTKEPSNFTDHPKSTFATKYWLIVKPGPLLDGRPGTILTQSEENELDSPAFSSTHEHQKPIAENVTGHFEMTENKLTLNSNEFVRTAVSKENSLIAKQYTQASKKVLHTTIVEEQTGDAKSRPKPVILIKNSPANIENYPKDFMASLDQHRSRPNHLHEIEKKSNHAKGNRLSVSEFKTFVEHAVRQLFFPLGKYLINENMIIVDEHPQPLRLDGKVMLKRFGFVNLPPVLRGLEPRQESRNWTLLSNNERLSLTTTIDKLFYEDNDDIRWLVLLSSNSTVQRIRNNFFEYLASSSVAKLSLEYLGCKINGLLMVPRRLMENVSLPGNGSSIEVNEELQIEESLGENISVELSEWHYKAFQLLTLKWEQRWRNEKLQNSRFVDTKHDDIELYIFVFLGAICTFGILSPLLYGVYRLIQSYSANVSFKVPSIFRDKFHYENHEKMSESRCESLNVIFSEEFDRKYSSWFDNSQHSSSILKPTADGSNSFFNDRLDDFPEFSDLTRNVCENSPRLNKENKVNMGCRGSCVLLPHPATYLMQNETEERYFDNPNYNNQETR